MVTPFHFIRGSLTCLAWMLGFISISHAAEVTAQLDQDTVKVGAGAMLTLTVTGGRASQPVIPNVANLIIQARGQSQQIRMINGETTISLTLSYVVGSNTPGDYEIPPIELTVGGESISTQALKLKVLPDSASQPPAGLAPGAPGTATSPQKPTETEDQFGFLTIELSASNRKHVYVGEIAPVRIRAWLPADSRAQLRSGIQPEGKAFTLHHVTEQPQQTREEKDGKSYLVVTWYGGMSATKAGTYPASLSLNATVAVRDLSAPAARRPRGGPFDDPFFDSAFDRMNARYIEKEVKLASRDQEIEVRSLPKEGRPENFSGAVGQFELGSPDIPAQWRTGDPQKITASVSGSGNFSLMKAPALTPENHWKTYEGKDEFTPGDEASFSGTKKFQFSAVPRKGGEQEVGMEMSFFDPTAGEYKSLTIPNRKIQVTGDDLVEQKVATASQDTPPVAKAEERLVAQKKNNSSVKSLTPLVSRPAFYYLLGCAAAMLGAGLGFSWLRKYRENPQRLAKLATEKALQEAMQAARSSAAANDVPGFFNAARRAIQERLGPLWNQSPQAITLAEVSERLPEDSPVVGFFREADLHEYSRLAVKGEQFPLWLKLLDQALHSLTPTTR